MCSRIIAGVAQAFPIFLRFMYSTSDMEKVSPNSSAEKPCPSENNNYRPVAITSNVVKALERILVETVRKNVEPRLDQYQFAYARNRSTCDAISTVTHLTLKHLESNDAYARMLFIDFSSAFNSIHPDILLRKLAQPGANPFVIRWYFSLFKRPQRVRFNSVLSEEALSSTGVP